MSRQMFVPVIFIFELCSYVDIQKIKTNYFKKINLEECCLLYKLIWLILHESYFWYLLSGDVIETTVSEVFSWVFILKNLYGKSILVLHFLTNAILCDLLDTSGLSVTALVFQYLLFSAPITWFWKSRNP